MSKEPYVLSLLITPKGRVTTPNEAQRLMLQTSSLLVLQNKIIVKIETVFDFSSGALNLWTSLDVEIVNA